MRAGSEAAPGFFQSTLSRREAMAPPIVKPLQRPSMRVAIAADRNAYALVDFESARVVAH
jgi:hypothetical protein